MNIEKYRELRVRLRRSVDYWLALTRIEFVGDVTRIMDEDTVSRSEMARRMKTSQPYISKALNGSENFTIRTMIKFAQALNAVLHVRLTKPGEVVRVLSAADISGQRDLTRVYTPLEDQSSLLWAWRPASTARPALTALQAPPNLEDADTISRLTHGRASTPTMSFGSDSLAPYSAEA